MIAKNLHQKGTDLREKDKHLLAIRYLNKAILEYKKEGDLLGVVDALKDRCLTWKHLFLLDKGKKYVNLAFKDAEEMFEFSKKNNLKEKLGTSYFWLGEISMLFEDFKKAIFYYEKSIKYFSGHPAEKGDFIYHLGEAVYRSGEKQKGLNLIKKGLRVIRKNKNNIDPFLIHVWETGCLMRLAELLYKEDIKKAGEYFIKAEKIVENDPKLIIRRRQIEKIKKELGIL